MATGEDGITLTAMAIRLVLSSHVRLMIPCGKESAATVTEMLGVEPTWVEETKPPEKPQSIWYLDSPAGDEEGDVRYRLSALMEVVRPFGERLAGLRPRFRTIVDVKYIVAQSPEFAKAGAPPADWFSMPAEMMRCFGEWGLTFSYAVYWKDQPEAVDGVDAVL